MPPPKIPAVKPPTGVKPIPKPGRKLSEAEAQEYVFRKHRGTFALLAKHS